LKSVQIQPPQLTVQFPKKSTLQTKTANAGRQRWLQGPFKTPEGLVDSMKEGERFSDPFDEKVKRARLHSKLDKLSRIAPVDFISRRAVKLQPFLGSVHAAAALVTK
jgi:hypothetical protein